MLGLERSGLSVSCGGCGESLGLYRELQGVTGSVVVSFLKLGIAMRVEGTRGQGQPSKPKLNP